MDKLLIQNNYWGIWTMQIAPSTKVLASWITSYVPEKDLFFLTEEQFQMQADHLDILVMPIDEFYSHSTYSQINYANSYEYWNIRNANYVIIAESAWIEQLSQENRQFILHAQIQCERGLTVPISFIQNLDEISEDYIVNEHVVLQRAMWEKLNWSAKEQLLKTMVYEWWDNGECQEIPRFIPSYLRPYANSFGVHQGANCLAAVLFAITEGTQPWFIHEWVYQKSFLEKLSQCNYERIETNDLCPRDVIAWQDENEVIQHAAYYIGENIFFNKHGQTMFNPWKLLTKEQLEKEWGSLKQVIFRNVNV